MTGSLNVPAEYPFILVVVVLTCLHAILQSIPIGGLRKALFTKEFFEKHFPEVKVIPREGYPEMGNGRFSDKLSTDEWMKFNNYQRAHLNGLELLTGIVVLELVAGLYYPRFTFALACVYIVGRQLFSMGYRSSGPNARVVGAITADVAIVLLLGAALYGPFTAAGGLPAFTAFVTSILKF